MLMIYSLPRCGSTNFLKLLNLCSSSDLLIDEPFHPLQIANCLSRLPSSTADLPQALAELGRTWLGFKHVWHINGWPFPNLEMNLNLLNQDLDVILLTRRNILQREVSTQMSAQLGIWHPNTAEKRQRFDTHIYEPLNQTAIGWILRNEPVLLQECRHRLQRGKKRWIEIAYEDLYAEGDADTRWLTFKKALDFAGLELPEGRSRFESLLTGCYRKINSPKTYAHIHDVLAVNLLYGSPETGYLF